MMLRVQAERMNASYFPSAREYSRRYGLDSARMKRLPDHAIVMHPGPMNRGMEITADVADHVRSVIVEQVTNGVAVRMAVLYLLVGGAPADDTAEIIRRNRMSDLIIRRVSILGADPTDIAIEDGTIAADRPSTSRPRDRRSTAQV